MKASAEGAQYESQGQARSEAERVAPGYIIKTLLALKGRNTCDYYGPFRPYIFFAPLLPGATCSASLHTCPWLLYCAPLAVDQKGASRQRRSRWYRSYRVSRYAPKMADNDSAYSRKCFSSASER